MIKKFSGNIVWVIVVAVILMGAFYVMSKNSDSNNTMYPDGLEVTVLENGSGNPIQNGSTAVMHYVGTLDDGTIFDSSYNRGEPFEFILGSGRVIQGWDIGVLGMKVGEKRKLTIAPEFAYGSRAVGSIPPNSRLTFEVELLEIK